MLPAEEREVNNASNIGSLTKEAGHSGEGNEMLRASREWSG